MHQALRIQEVLRSIFDHCRLSGTGIPTSDLPVLARTCQAFKEPALDILWQDLPDPSPVARCLPGAYRSSRDMCYSFCRPLTQTEWVTLRSYARRVVSVVDEDDAFDWESVGAFLDPPSTEPLLPNLRHLHATQSTGIKHLLSMPFPSLISLRVWLMPQDGDLHTFRVPLQSISKFSPDIRTLSVSLRCGHVPFNNMLSGYICRWQNLQILDCPCITLDKNALAHLCRVPALTKLTFKLGAPLLDQIALSDPPLCFSDLLAMTLYSDSLDLISGFLSRVRLPLVTDFSAFIEICPSNHGISYFLDSLQTSGISRTIRGLWLVQMLGMYDATETPKPVLGFEDLQPCMAFGNLRRIELNIDWIVELADANLLTLASAWPYLEYLVINKDFGWNTPGGITPNGLMQLLQTSPSLNWITLAIDTRGYTNFLAVPEGFGSTSQSRPYLIVDVVDSIIEAECVAAVGAFFASIAPHPNFSFCAWAGFAMNTTVYQYRWFDVHRLAKATCKCS